MALPKVADLYSARRETDDTLYSDFLVNFNAHPDNSQLIKNVNEDAIIRSLKNLLFTNKYERLFQPTIGSNLKNLLFEPVSPQTESNIKEEIKRLIENYEPRVNIVDLVVSAYPDRNAYIVSLTFYMTTIQDTLTINIPLIRVK
jgi:phage baseplate assembly protein W